MTKETLTPPAQDTPEAGAVTETQAPPQVEVKAETLMTESEPKPPVDSTAAPEKYELKLPENTVLDASYLSTIEAYAKEHKLTNDQAQAVLNRESAAVKGHLDAQAAAFKEQVNAWGQEVAKDKELGGEAFKANVELAKRVVDRFGTDAFKNTLNETGLGNHPELVRMLFRIGKQMADDEIVTPGTQGVSKRSPEDIFYGSTKKE